MPTRTEQGYIVLADISGYTSYLASTELDHAQEILSELLELIVHCFTPTLTLAGLHGDAVFACGPANRLSRGETLLELIETTYVAFRDRLASMKRNTTCTRNACRAIPSLDVKFITHHGDYVAQRVAGSSELVGPDVIIAHRLLKNHVSESTGWRGYALFTERCLEHMCVPPGNMHRQIEALEHLGDIVTYSLDLQRRYTELVEHRRIVVDPEQADAIVTHDIPGPPPITWNWLNDAQKRLIWEGQTVRPELNPDGRSGIGARDHCLHGKNAATVLTIVDWQPFDYLTVSSVDPASTHGITFTIQLAPIAGCTRVTYFMQVQYPWPKRLMFKFMLPLMYKRKLAVLASLVEAEIAQEATEAANVTSADMAPQH